MVFGLRTFKRALEISLKSNFRRHLSMASPEGVALTTIVEKLCDFAPLGLSEKWDNTGVLVEPFTKRAISKVLLTNDLTESVMEEAITEDVQMIISYHPPIFSGLKRITQNHWKERIVSKCFEYRIAVYSPHTSWDSVEGGVNDWLATCLPPHRKRCIVEGPIPESGQGRLCCLEEPTPLCDIINSVKELIGVDNLQLALAKEHEMISNVNSVALCAGSGVSVLRGVKTDVFLTGEMSHHEILDAVHCGTSVILTNHSNSERGFLNVFSKKLEEMLDNNVTVIVSKEDNDPLIFV